MPKEEENIFQAAANKLRASKQASTPAFQHSKKISTTPSDPELDNLIGRLKNMYQNVQEAFNILAKQFGMSPTELHAWLEDEKHLLPSQQILLKELTLEFKNNLSGPLPQDPKKLHKSSEEIEKEAKNRKAKTLGSRKNWIPMR